MGKRPQLGGVGAVLAQEGEPAFLLTAGVFLGSADVTTDGRKCY